MANSIFQCLVTVLLASVALASVAPKCPLENVCFVLDRSGSMHGSYDKVQEFTVGVTNNLDARSSDILYSAYGFSDASILIQAPTKNLADFLSEVQKTVVPTGGTNMYAGMHACFDELKDAPGPRVIVLVTDGVDTSFPKRAIELKPMLEAANMGIVTVGIGNSINENYLRDFATKPEFFIESSITTLPERALKVSEEVCEASTPAKDVCQVAYDACEFRFASHRQSVPTFNIGGPVNEAFTGKIVSRKAPRVGVLNTNGIVPEFINADGTANPITDFGSQKFTPTHFKPFTIPRKNQFSGIGHQTFQGNQEGIARGQCVRVFFSTYQTITSGRNPTVINNVNVVKEDMKCVVFKTS